jgi:hypothetical protein
VVDADGCAEQAFFPDLPAIDRSDTGRSNPLLHRRDTLSSRYAKEDTVRHLATASLALFLGGVSLTQTAIAPVQAANDLHSPSAADPLTTAAPRCGIIRTATGGWGVTCPRP